MNSDRTTPNGDYPRRDRSLAAASLTTLWLAVMLCVGGPRVVAAGEAGSETFAGIVELFTSQGCANCPPADALLSNYARRDGVIALSYHVDYWDYIGWKDTLATRQNAERQRAYGKTFKAGAMVTPQIIVNGMAQVDGADAAAVEATLSKPHPETHARVKLSQSGGTLRVVAKSEATHAGEAAPVLMLVTYRDETLTSVARGANEGRHLRNTNVVLDWRVLGTAGEKRVEIELPVSTLTVSDEGRTGCAAFLQTVRADGAPGPIIAGAMLSIEP